MQDVLDCRETGNRDFSQETEGPRVWLSAWYFGNEKDPAVLQEWLTRVRWPSRCGIEGTVWVKDDESFNSFINLDSTERLRWEMTQYSEILFNNDNCPQTARGCGHRRLLYLVTVGNKDCDRGVCCGMCRFELDWDGLRLCVPLC